MEQFNHKISKLKKELINISFDLNYFKTNNHKTISRIIDNLNTIQNKSKIQTINTTNDNIIKHNTTNSNSNTLNNYKMNLCYTKKSVSLEKNCLYPFKQTNNNTDIISLSECNLINNNNNNKKRSISSYLNNNKQKNKIYIKNDLIDDLAIYDKIDSKKIIDKNNYIFLYNEDNIKQKNNPSNKYITLDDKYFDDKENQNIKSNYNHQNSNKDNNIYSYNHNLTNNRNKNKYNYNFLYNKTLSMIENEKNDIKIKSNKKNLIIKDNCKTFQNMNNIEPKIEIIELNSLGYNYNYKKNKNSINEHPYINNMNINNNISQKIKSDNLFNETNMKNNINIYNNQKINTFREKILTNSNNKQKNINDNINLNNNKLSKNNIMNQIKEKLDVNNFEEAKIKINNLMKCQNFFKNVENIYCKYNNERNYNINDILLWIFSICKCYSNNKYKSYFNKIMKFHNLENIEELKFFVNKYIEK